MYVKYVEKGVTIFLWCKLHPESLFFKISHLGHKTVDKLPSSEGKKVKYLNGWH